MNVYKKTNKHIKPISHRYTTTNTTPASAQHAAKDASHLLKNVVKTHTQTHIHSHHTQTPSHTYTTVNVISLCVVKFHLLSNFLKTAESHTNTHTHTHAHTPTHTPTHTHTRTHKR